MTDQVKAQMYNPKGPEEWIQAAQQTLSTISFTILFHKVWPRVTTDISTADILTITLVTDTVSSLWTSYTCTWTRSYRLSLTTPHTLSPLLLSVPLCLRPSGSVSDSWSLNSLSTQNFREHWKWSCCSFLSPSSISREENDQKIELHAVPHILLPAVNPRLCISAPNMPHQSL